MNAYEHNTNKYMIENNCTLIEMYRRMNVVHANHQKYVNGRMPMVDKGYKIAKFLNLPIWELWGLEE